MKPGIRLAATAEVASYIDCARCDVGIGSRSSAGDWERLNRRSCWCATAWIWSDSSRRRSTPIRQRPFCSPRGWIRSSSRCWWPISPQALSASCARSATSDSSSRATAPRENAFERRVHKLGLDALFDFRGQVDDLAPLYAACDVRDSSFAQRGRAAGGAGSTGQRAAGSGFQGGSDPGSAGLRVAAF